jgi:hypothetical protein
MLMRIVASCAASLSVSLVGARVTCFCSAASVCPSNQSPLSVTPDEPLCNLLLKVCHLAQDVRMRCSPLSAILHCYYRC